MAAHRGTEKASAEAPRKAPGAPEVLGAADPEAPVGAVLRRLPAMVFLTTRLWLRNRVTDRYFRVQEVLKHARHFRGRKNRCYRLAVRAVTRAFVKCTRARRLKKRILRTVSAPPISSSSWASVSSPSSSSSAAARRSSWLPSSSARPHITPTPILPNSASHLLVLCLAVHCWAARIPGSFAEGLSDTSNCNPPSVSL
uniref:Uncharacterized protein n=1 Tax=Marmota marmota marmota TaxID=9994 RepID=A0A8C5ZZW1_MARMA